MANCGKNILLTREGSDQMQRYLKALDPESLKLNDFSLKEWMQFAFNFAKYINYFDTNNAEIPSGNWKDFFIADAEIEKYLKKIQKDSEVKPYLALFLCFIKLLEYPQKRFNHLNKRHLDFFYMEILKIEKQSASMDKLYAIFELAKTVNTTKIGKGTELDGGKDKNGKKLIYKTTDELIVNQAKVACLKSVYNDRLNKLLKVATVADSLDGKGTEFTDEARWWPFGYVEAPHKDEEADKREYTELENACVGFAISGKILKLKEGERNIQLKLNFKKPLPVNFNISSCFDYFKIECSGEKNWLGSFSFEKKLIDGDKQTVFESNLSANRKILKLAFQISRDEKAVTAYDKKVHGANYNISNPVCRFNLKLSDQNSYNLFHILSKAQIASIEVKVKVNSVKSLLLKNDTGILNAQKPFFPFGTQPVKDSRFIVDYPEMFEKYWDNFDLKINWKDTPDDFVEHYKAYRNSFKKTITSDALKEELKKTSNQDYYLKKTSDFTATPELMESEQWKTVQVDSLNDKKNKLLDNIELFVKNGSSYETEFRISYISGLTRPKGPLRLTLDKDFGHKLFPKIYALAVGSNESTVFVPNSPYTPLVDSITLHYAATETITTIYHEHPFGHSNEIIFSDIKLTTVLSDDYTGGNLFVGLENIEAGQTISLLVQVFEGSENPLKESFTEQDKVEWSVLCSDQWIKLDFNYMISNEIDNFLKSGIVKFSIPKGATTQNTIFPENYIWVKANMNKDYDVVCKVIGISAQAVLSEFVDNKNELSHLKNGIEANSVSGLVNKVTGIKGVSQPYSSFGGMLQETDKAFYQRVSERLRHKNRAISIWDYEHLILQQFPEIHKVKCLNHSKIKYNEEGKKEISFLSPGNVLIVVIPDIVNKNVFDIYQPRVSKTTLNSIQSFINQLNTFHINAEIINPEYEEVSVSLNVKFHKGYDENYYKKELNKDITKFLSPWAFESTAKIRFGITLHNSAVTSYIEKLEYVDYVKKVGLNKNGVSSTTYVLPSSPEAILVSSKEHDIKIN